MLITPVPGALLTTVRSRCQRVLFQPLAPDELRSVLETLTMEERQRFGLSGGPGSRAEAEAQLRDDFLNPFFRALGCFQRLLAQGKVHARKHEGFWGAMDTFKDKITFDRMEGRGDCPWMIWKRSPAGVSQ